MSINDAFPNYITEIKKKTSEKMNISTITVIHYSFFMGIFLKHLWLISHILKWKECKILTKLVPSQTPSRSSHRRCLLKRCSWIFAKFRRKTSVLESLLACNFIKKRLQHIYFPVKFCKFLRTPIWRTSANDSFYSS